MRPGRPPSLSELVSPIASATAPVPGPRGDREGFRPPILETDKVRAGLAIRMVALSLGVSVADMTSRRRIAPRACRARYLAMYLTHIAHGWPLDRVAYAFGVNRATAANGCRWAEDARDAPDVDAMMERLDIALRSVCEVEPVEVAQ